MKLEGFWPLVDLQSKIKPGVVPQSVKCGLLKGFVIAGATITDENSRKEYWQRILIPIQSRFKNIICRENFNRIYQEEQVKSEIIDLLESFTGIASGVSISTMEELFSFFMNTILSELPTLLNLYHNYEIVVQLILKLFNECVNQMLINISPENTKKMYEYCFSVVQVYARCNANRFTTEVIAEEDNCQDLMLVMKLLTALLLKDCFSFTEGEVLPIVAGDIVLYGIDFILPLMTIDLLKYPSLCKQYYKMISFVAEMHPQKVCDLREELLKQLIMSIQLGFVQFSSDILTCSLDFVESLAKHIDEKDLQNSSVSQLVIPLLKVLFDLILSHQINGDMISSASTALYALICCYPEQYKLYVRNLIQSQFDPTIAERLESAFTNLTPNIYRASIVNRNRLQFGRRPQFRDNFDKFITSVHSFLLIK